MVRTSDNGFDQKYTLRENCPYSAFSWSVISCIHTEYGEISVHMWENTDQKNSEYGHFLHSEGIKR